MANLLAASVVFLASPAAAEAFCQLPPEEQAQQMLEPVEMCGTSTIRGSEAGVVRVHIPREVTLRNPWLDGSDITIVGEGRFVGFALVEDVPARDGSVWLGGRLPTSAESRPFLFDLSRFFANSDEVESYAIPAGNYLLYLLPDEHPVEVTFHLSELSGAVSLSPSRPAVYDLRFPDPRFPSPGGNIYSAGGAATLQSQGQLFEALWFTASTHVATVADSCFFEGEPPDPAGYLPACTAVSVASMGNLPPNLYEGEGSVDPRPTSDSLKWFHYGEWSPAESGIVDPSNRLWGQTLTLETASKVEALGSLTLWLSFD